MKKWSTSLAIKEMQITLRFISLLSEWLPSRIQTKINVGKEVGKKEPSYPTGGKVNLYNHYGKHYRGSSRN
jgi:hypothetical protein